MQIAILSDTHGHVRFTLEAVRYLEQFQPELILHCGDIGSAEIPPLLKSWPVHYVLGNVDYESETLIKAIETSGGTYYGRFANLSMAEKQVALLHSDDQQKFQQTLAEPHWDLVCYGHTHQAKREVLEDKIVLNPGAIYRANPRSFALVETETWETHYINLP